MQVANQSKLTEQDINEIANLFDLLAMYDFEDAQKRQACSEEIGKGFSLVGGEPFLASCEQQDKQTD